MSIGHRRKISIIVLLIVVFTSIYVVFFSDLFASAQREYVGSGEFWFLVSKFVVYDPPGDNSSQTINISYSTPGRIFVVFNITSNSQLRVFAKLNSVGDSVGALSFSPISNGFVVEEFNLISESTSSLKASHSQNYIGPTRIVDGDLCSGNRFVGLRIFLSYAVYKVTAYRFGTIIDEHLELIYNITSVSRVSLNVSDFISSLSNKRIFEVFDNSYSMRHGVSVANISFHSSQLVSFTKEYRDFEGAWILVDIGNITLGELSLHISCKQKFVVNGKIKLSLILHDDDPSDWFNISVYEDLYYPTLIVLATSSSATNPTETYP